MFSLKLQAVQFLGVILSAIILMPVILAYIGDGRSSESYVHTWIYSMDYYRNFLASMITCQTKLGILRILDITLLRFLPFAFYSLLKTKVGAH